MLGLNHLQSFLFIVALTSFGFTIRIKRDKVNVHTTPYRIVMLVSLVLFCIGLGAVMCQIGNGFGLSLPLAFGSVPIAVLVRNCSEVTEEEYPDREARILGALSLCGVLAAGF